MKNRIKLLLISFILLFAFGITVKAEDTTSTNYQEFVITRTFNISPKSGKKMLYSSTAIELLKCGKDTKYVNGDEKSGHYYSSKYTNIMMTAGTYYIESNGKAKAGDKETIICTFESIDPSYNTSSDPKFVGYNGPGTLKLIVKFNEDSPNNEYRFTLNSWSNKSKAVIGTGTPFDDVNISSVKYEILALGKEYISVNNSGGKYVVSANDNVPDEGATAQVNFTYKDKDGATRTLKVVVELRNGFTVYAHPGEGDCGASLEAAGWSKSVLNKAMENSPMYKDSYSRKYHGGDFQLPVCEVTQIDTARPIKFAGWNYMRRNSTTYAIDECAKDSKTFVDANVGLSISKDEARDYRDYVACYVSDNSYAIIHPDFFSISDSKWKKSTLTGGGTYYYAKVDSSGLKMPTATSNREVEITGYAKVEDSCDNTQIKVGEQITTGGSYKICYKTSEGKKGDDTIQITESLDLYLYESKSEEQKLAALDVVKTTSCSSSNTEYVSANYRNGDCIISAKKATSTPVEITYLGERKDGKKVKVIFKTSVTGVELQKKQVQKKEGKVVNDNTGFEENEYATFITGGDERKVSCDDYQINPVKSTREKKGIKIGHLKWGKKQNEVDLNAHVYFGSAKCEDGTKTTYVGLCLDPGRAEPGEDLDTAKDTETNDYAKTRSIETGTERYMDNLIATIYADNEFKAAISSVNSKNVAKGDISNKSALAAATFALRFMSIELQDDTNNKGLGLAPYHNAYKAIVHLVNKKTGASSTNVEALASLKTNGATTNANHFLCTGNSSSVKECSFENAVLNKAFAYLADSIKYTEGQAKTIKIKVTTTSTSNKGDKLIIKGNISGLTGDVGDFFTFEKYCPLCGASGIKTKIQYGRDYKHLINYNVKHPNILKSTYDELAPANSSVRKMADWESKNGAEGYKYKRLYNENGVLYFKVTLYNVGSASLDRIHNTVTGCMKNRGSQDLDWKFYLRLSTQANEAHNSTAIATPVNSVNVQTQVIFARPGRAGKGGSDANVPYNNVAGDANKNANGNPNADKAFCNGNTGKGKQNTNGELEGELELDAYANGYGPTSYFVTLGGPSNDEPVSQEDTTVSGILPKCDLSKTYLNYEQNCSTGEDSGCNDSFDGVLFAASGCCSMITDRNNGAYRNYCADPKCTYETVSNVCVEKAGQEGKLTEQIKITEGKKADGTPQMLCVYENKDKWEHKSDFKEKKDIAGNSYKMREFNNNSVCNVYCKEDWEFKVPNIKNFVGTNAVLAGQYFVLKHDDIASKGTRTCVSSKINLDKILTQLQEWSRCEVEAFMGYKMGQAYGEVLDTANASTNVQDLGDVLSCGPGGHYQRLWQYNLYDYTEVKPYTLNDKDEKVYGNSYNDCSCSASYDSNSRSGVDCGTTHTKQVKDVNSCKISDYKYGVESCPDGAKGCVRNTDKGTGGEWNTNKCEVGTEKMCHNYRVYANQFTYETYAWENNTVTEKQETVTFDAKEYGDDVNKVSSSDGYGGGECNKENKDNSADGALKLAKADWQEKLNAKMAPYVNSACGTDFTVYKNKILNLSKDLRACQRFAAVTNESDLRANGVVQEGYEFEHLVSFFNPTISYEYEEPTYGKQIVGRNKLIRSYKQDSEVRKIYYYSDANHDFDENKYEGPNGVAKDGINEKNLTKSKFDSITDAISLASCSDFSGSGTGTRTVGKNKENGGHTESYSWSAEPGCTNYSYDYVKDTNYVKATVSQESTYSNAYKWYVDEDKNYKVLAQNAAEAAKMSESTNKNEKRYSLYGTEQKDNIVFPVGITTKRNLYQYAFRYTDVGMYNNKKDTTLGRLMGGANAVIQNNTRTCFYEVLEGLCTCCGDVIDTEVVTPTGKTTHDLVDNKQLCLDSSQCKMQSTRITTREQIEDAKDNAQYNIINSTITLGSIKENLGRAVGSNWSEASHYTLNGQVFMTPKGASLLKSIDGVTGKGEEIYNNDTPPEYSYVLNPSAMADIRQYNEDAGYQDRASSRTPVSQTKVMVTDSSSYNEGKWKSNWKNEQKQYKEVSFTHWKSTFLEVLKQNHMENPEYAGKLLTDVKDENALCYVLGSEFDGSKHLTEFGKIHTTSVSSNTKLYDGKVPQCRWVDYVGQISPTAINGAAAKQSGYYRLAFK